MFYSSRPGFLLSIMCFALCMVFTSAHADNSNLLANPGFENIQKGFPIGWGTFEEKARSMAAIDREYALDGKYSLRMTGDPAEAWEPVFSDNITVTPSGEYTLAGYCKSNATDGEILFNIREISSDGQTAAFQQVPIPMMHDWAFYHQKFKLGERTTTVQVFLILPKCKGNAWFDNLMFVKGDLEDIDSLKSKAKVSPQTQSGGGSLVTLKGNILPNNGFEAVDVSRNLPSDWVFVSSDKNYSAGIVRDKAFAGKTSVIQKHANSGLPGSYMTTKTPITVLPNRNYRFSGWVMTSPDGRSAWTTIPSVRRQRVEGSCLQLMFKDDTGSVIDEVWSPVVQTGGKWERLEINGKAPGDAYHAEIRLYHGDFKGNSWFDSIRLETLEDGDSSIPEWKLHKDVYTAGKLPPAFKLLNPKGQLSVQLAEDSSDEYMITMKPADKGKPAVGSLKMPPIDTSFPGDFSITGEYRLQGDADAGISVDACDIYDNVLFGKTIRFNPTPIWQKFSLPFTARGESEHLTAKINAAGKGYLLSLRGLKAERLSKVSLEEYAGISVESNAKASVQPVSYNNKPTELPDVQICQNNGIPTLKVNGQVTGLDQFCNTYRPFDSVIRNCEEAGLIQVLSLLDIDWEKGPAGVNLAELDHQVRQVLKNAPNANIILCPDSTGTLSPKQWSHYNPSERYVNDLGESDIKSYGGAMKTFPSMASQKWQQDMDEMLVRVVEHVRKSDYANRVIGYWLSGYEWFQWEWSYGDRMDYSVHMRDAFRKWLQEKYGNVEALRKAWSSNSVLFDTVEIPSTADRRKTADGVFRDPAASQNVIDFVKFYSDLVADVLIRQGKAVKTASGKNTLTCSFYGYTTLFFDGISRETSGHSSLKRALESGYLDFTISPSDGYAFERGIGGTGGYNVVPGTLTLHNSIFTNEPDFRTHWAGQDIERTNTTRDDINIFRREFAMNLTNLVASQWYDFSTGYQLGDARLTKELARLKKVTQFAQKIDRAPYSEGMAVIVSEDVSSYIGTDKFLFDGGLLYHQRWLFFRTGMPHTYYLMSDLASPKMPDYKLYLFVNAFKLTEQEKAMIRSKCMRSGSVVMFVYAPGYVDEHGLSVENMKAFLGINIAKMDGDVEAKININADAKYVWLKDSSGIVYGQSIWSPMFYVDDSTANTLGTYTGTGKSGLAYKDFGDYKVVYSGACLLPPDLLRAVGRLAGCHVYLDTNDALYADKNFVSVHAKASGVKKIKLPAKADVYDLINHRVVARNVDSLEVYMNGNETALFYVGKADEAISAFKQ